MYSGQGTQYYNMGKELYYSNEVFKKSMDYCDSLLQAELEESLVSILYDKAKHTDSFDNVLYTHPAIFSIGYSLTQVLAAQKIFPDIVLGYSLGEFIAAVVAGIVSLEDALNMVVQQAKMLSMTCEKGGMMVIFDDLENFVYDEELNRGCTLSGVNYKNSYVISGKTERLRKVNTYLSNKSVISYILPVNYAFHSQGIESIKEEFCNLIKTVEYKTPEIPSFSCAKVGEMKNMDNHFWEVIRNNIQFESLSTQLVGQEDCLFVDVGPSGTLSNFIKNGFNGKVPSFTTIDQYGKNIKSLNNLYSNLQNYGFMN